MLLSNTSTTTNRYRKGRQQITAVCDNFPPSTGWESERRSTCASQTMWSNDCLITTRRTEMSEQCDSDVIRAVIQVIHMAVLTKDQPASWWSFDLPGDRVHKSAQNKHTCHPFDNSLPSITGLEQSQSCNSIRVDNNRWHTLVVLIRTFIN